MNTEYYITSISDKVSYSNNNDCFYYVYLSCNTNPNVRLELKIEGIKFKKEVEKIVSEFNNPLRMSNTYDCSDIEFIEDSKLFYAIVKRYSFVIRVSCLDKEMLSNFLTFINTPPEVDVETYIEEHNRLCMLIEGNKQNIKKLEEQKRALEYHIWRLCLSNDQHFL